MANTRILVPPLRWVRIVCLVALVVATAVEAHDIEVEGEPQDWPAAEHLPCEQGFAGRHPCMNMELVQFLPAMFFGGQQTNDLWGWTDPESGIEYVILGLRDGTAFFELDDHGHPTFLGHLPTRTDPSAWRDIKVYDHYAYIVSEARFHGLQVFDLERLRDVPEIPAEFTTDRDVMGMGSSHNIAINEETAYAYVVGSQRCNGGLYMLDIESPLSPRFVGCFDADGYTHDTQCVIYHGPDARYLDREVCFNSNEDTLTIVDVTDKSAPLMLSRTPYFSSRYTHQGWLTEDHAFFLLDDELDEQRIGTPTRTFVWNVHDLEAPILRGAHKSASTAIDHNQYVVGNHVFQANYRSGVRVLRLGDLDRAELVEVAYLDTVPEDDDAELSGVWSVYPYFASGFIAASDINQGLFILRPDLDAVAECDDGIDNDGDGLRDFPEDPSCLDPDGADESLRRDVEITRLPSRRARRGAWLHRHWQWLVIWGSDSVDVTEIDLASLALGPDGVRPLGLDRARKWRGRLRDRNDDGRPDLLLRFRRRDVKQSVENGAICLSGRIGEDEWLACEEIVERPATVRPRPRKRASHALPEAFGSR